jgi:hypothetical protein
MRLGRPKKCPKCSRSFQALDWIDDASCTCRYCHEDFESVSFAAQFFGGAVATPQAVVMAEDSTCFFHSSNQADEVCDGCGRFLCAVCAVPFGGRTLCPSCIAAGKKDGTTTIPERSLPGGIGLALALGPMLIWPLTLVTAPVALGFVIIGWNNPGSLVRPGSRGKLILAGVIAVLQIVAWAALGLRLWLK